MTITIKAIAHGLRCESRRYMYSYNEAEVESVKSEGELNALTPYRELPVIESAWNKAYDDHFRKKNFVSFLRGTLKELDRN
jgi:hypothetical protein